MNKYAINVEFGSYSVMYDVLCHMWYTITIYTIYYIRNIQNNGSLYVGCVGHVSYLLV